MAKDKLTKKQQEELEELTKEMVKLGKEVAEDFEKNPSEVSGSITQIHMDSPYLLEKEERLVKIGDKELKIKPDVD